jgi:predicted membrane protein
MRAASSTLAGIASLIGLVFPFLLARSPTNLNQSLLLLLMEGIAGAFIFGAGFRPHSKLARAVIAPWATWPVMLGSLGGLFWLR